ncbi:DUF2637 domain-containing protein [Streptomyces spectabilis]|uniref:DUF2637 domain-containing protein n=1 Tax=Streptomyces spectabilis TaxID=68270 RepID=A0A5P2XRZ9_STRST|nr:DUF2637 domain-containing protein [Streptomyces spectabilis]MBB5102369.1 hypothetical protein [Streptomyces spectabilis]MCI3907416.1 DUF2637 domain-containing protein [Streptomyces spectabilis]QEV65222.1 DUF2637 domain-containing protein [Streptomyces spectabilis]GGV30378.1 hypothetical protein GCM10010245_49440 [Streptomyces spectabilis]
MSQAPENRKAADKGRGFTLDSWIRPLCALLVAGVAAYASYVHQRTFALQGGADEVSAALWPLSVDGLLLLATAGLLKSPGTGTRRTRGAMWSAFLLGIAVSLAANTAAAPALAWQPVLVAGWPPVALLLAVELLMHRTGVPADGEAGPAEERSTSADSEGADEGEDPLLARAQALDARYREVHQRPVSAETLRRELRVGAARSRRLAALVRRRRSDGRNVGVRGHRPNE